jgi:hypothetical protein
MNCDHTFPDGVTYDLTPLTRCANMLDPECVEKLSLPVLQLTD